MTQPNLLILLADGMQAETADPGHVCRTPTLDRLAAGGLRFTNAHTTSPTCSPARASLMTGLLPHNHGVLEVEHGRDEDQCVLRTECPHFAQALSEAGYRTGYFGKWHIERSHDVVRFGWRESVVKGAKHVRYLGRGDTGPDDVVLDESLCGYLDGPPGYRRILHWGVTDGPPDQRYPGRTATDAIPFLRSCLAGTTPWCCCVSFAEPNEALIVGRDEWDRYSNMDIPLPANFRDDLDDRPNLYRRERDIAKHLTKEHWQAARACYFGRISELDAQLERLVDCISDADLTNTIVVFLADHGRYVGAHGFDAHNVGAFEEIYRIPLIMSGGAIPSGVTSNALVSIADVGSTLCELGSGRSLGTNDARSFAPELLTPATITDAFPTGFAEYHGTRFPLMQRVLWQNGWKLVFNGFDFDELYNLDDDPYETRNHADDPQLTERVKTMMAAIWERLRNTGDRAVLESHYFSMRLACVGPDLSE